MRETAASEATANSHWRQAVGLAIAYFIAAAVGILLTREAGNVAALWPANALLLAALLRCRRRRWLNYLVACALANFVANLGFGDPVPVALGFVFCNLAEVLSAAILLRYVYTGRWDLGSIKQLLAFTGVAGVVAPAIGASLGAGLVKWAFDVPYASVWSVWWIADAIGFLIVTPVALLASRARCLALMQRHGWEAAALFIALGAATYFLFSQPLFPLLYLVAPILLWSAFRLDVFGSVVACLMVSAISIAMTIYGLGPIPVITSGDMASRVQFLQLFLGIAVLMPMVVAVLLSAMRRTERSLHDEKNRAQVTLRSIGEAVITTDADGLVDFVNPVAVGLTGWSSSEAMGQPIEAVFTIVNRHDRGPALSPVLRCLADGAIVGLDGDTILVGREGAEYAIQDSVAPIWGPDQELIGAVLVFSDVTERQRLAREARHHASHDDLTGLVNRREFENRLRRALQSAHRDDSTHALVYLDLDQFKIINDTKGHSAGDELLRQLSMLLGEQIRRRDTFARLGGDEFGFLMEHCSLEKAHRVAETLLTTVGEFRFVWEQQSFRIGASMGLVAVDGTSRTIAELLRRADTACYAAKDRGRNRIHTYNENDSRLNERHGEMQWVARIESALDEDRFTLYFQPMVALTESSADRLHFELLVRLKDEHGQIVPPGAFLPAAERYGLATMIDKWVIRHALTWLARRPPIIAQTAQCAINLSGQSLADSKMAAYIEQQLRETGVPPDKVCFEVTETMAIANLATATALFDRIQALGCKFALDDFGSGLSSFTYLKALPVDYLKIDGSFVKDIADDPINLAMVKSINELGHATGKQTIAEFAENEIIVSMLRDLGVDYAQGYGLGHPEPLETLVVANVVAIRTTS